MRALRTLGGVGLVALVLVVTAVDLHDDHTPKPPLVPSHATNNLRAELLRCQLLGKAALDDASCSAVWAENRRRFFSTASKETRVP
jgi:conjugative transfer region protein TrbK